MSVAALVFAQASTVVLVRNTTDTPITLPAWGKVALVIPANTTVPVERARFHAAGGDLAFVAAIASGALRPVATMDAPPEATPPLAPLAPLAPAPKDPLSPKEATP